MSDIEDVLDLQEEMQQLRAENLRLSELCINVRAQDERLRATLAAIAVYFENEFREGEKAYQAAILAREALGEGRG